MRILHLSAVKTWGGGENHLLNLCDELKLEAEIENQVFCVSNSILQERLSSTDIPVISAPLVNKMDPRYVLKLVRLCKREKFDLLHIHDSTALTLAVMADHFCSLPDFILSKKTSFPIRNRRQTLYKYNYPKIRKILCVSEATKEVGIRSVKGKERFKVIYHGTRIYNKDRKSPFPEVNKLKVPEGKILIGNIANHIEAKHLETFLHTAHYLVHLKKQDQFHFVQIGSFSKRTDALIRLRKELKLEDHVSFTGYLPEASRFIPQFNVMLITSENEGIPQVIYESFYHEVPVVSTNVGGISEAIENHVNGLLCEPYDHVNLGENILFLMDNPQVIATFAEISRKKLLQHFTSAQMARRTLEEYKKVVDGEQHQ